MSPHSDIEPLRPLRARSLSAPRRQDLGATTGWPLAWPLLALVAGWAIITWPWLIGRVTIPWDAKAGFLPQIQFLAQSLARGDSPFWAPYAFSGQNQIADPQSMIFSPPFLLLALIDANPSAWAVDVTVLLAQLAGAAALLVWFRDQRWHWAGGIVAGLAFAFGASMAWRVQHTGQVLSLAYWPLAMLALDRMQRTRAAAWRTYLWAVALGLVLAAILLGRDQVALLVVYVLAAYGAWRVLGPPARWTRLKAAFPPLVLAGGVAVLGAGIPVLLTELVLSTSNRPFIDIEGAGRGSLHPALLLTAVIPQLFGAAFRMEDYWGPPSFAWNDTGLFIAQNMGQIYIGLLPVLLILLAALRRQLWDSEIRFFVITFGLIVLYALGWYTPVFGVIYALVPGVNLYRRPADATFLIGALGAVLAGYATHRLFAQPWERLRQRDWIVAIGVAGAAVLIATFLAIRFDRLALLSYPLLVAAMTSAGAALALALAVPRMALEPWTAALILGGAIAGDLAYNNGPSSSSGLPPALYEVFDPHTPNPVITTLKALVEANETATRRDRIELLGLGFHWPNASLTHRLENTLGYNPLRSKLYSDATGAGDNIGLPDERKFTPLLPSYRSRLVDMLGLRYVAAGAPLATIDPKLKPGDWPLIAQIGTVWIYENPRALPRVMFAATSIGVDFDTLIRTGRWPVFDPRTTVLLPMGHDASFVAGGVSSGTAPTVAIASYANTVVSIDAESAGGGFVVLNDLWQPWWFADIDGKPAPIVRANVLFRAVEVPAGRHRVTFTFRPLQGAWRQINGQSPTTVQAK